MSFSSQTLAVGQTLDQKFTVMKLLGQGAFGATYLVKHVHFGTSHVIKEYLPDTAVRLGNTVSPKSQMDTELFEWGLKRFYDEANLLYRLNHPNVVKVTDLFQAHGTAYFVMPYLGDVTLESWIKANPNPSEDALLSIFVPLLEGLKYIHGQGLLHRDIKPSNILIGQDGNPVLIDFGSARNAIGKKSKLLTKVLTPHFAPIEQYSSNADFTQALDLYSLAGAMYEALIHELPPPAPDRLNNDRIIVLSEHVELTKRYSPHFLQAIDRNLSFLAKNRDQSAMQMQNCLMGFEEGGAKSDLQMGNEPCNTGELMLWQDSSTINTMESYQYYLSIFPLGQFAEQARQKVLFFQNRKERNVWQETMRDNTLKAYQAYLVSYPNGQYVAEAQAFIDILQASSATGVDYNEITSQDSNTKIAQSTKSSQVHACSATNLDENVKLLSMGRIGRLHYWNYNCLCLLIGLICLTGFYVLSKNEVLVNIGGMLVLGVALIRIILDVRRFKDLGQSPWFILAHLLFIAPLIILYLVFARGNEMENKYGLPPKVYLRDKVMAFLYPLLIFVLIVLVVYYDTH